MEALDYRSTLRSIHNKAKYNPVWFFENILNVKTTAKDNINWNLDTWQKETLEAVADVWRYKEKKTTKFNHEGLNKFTIRAMHGPGKTFTVAGIMHYFNFIFPGLIVCTGPKEKTLKTRLWPAFRKIRSRAEPAYRELTKIDSTKITWCDDDDWVAHIEAASVPENLAGYHEDYMLFIVDEASGVKEEMFPVIEGALSTGTIVIFLMIGNPTQNQGTFYDSHMKQRVAKNYYKIHVDLAKTTRVSHDWVQQMVDKYGPKSPTVKVRCYGDFAEMDENQLIAMQWLIDARNRTFRPDGSHPKLRISVDVADGGEDETSITIARHYQSVTLFTRQHNFSFPQAEAPIEAAKKAIELFEEHKGNKDQDDFVVDAIGVGAGTAGYLLDQGYRVIPYRGGAKSDDTAKWRNRRVQSYLVGRNALRDHNIIISERFTDTYDHRRNIDEGREWDDFCAQMCSVHTKPGTERVEDLETKEELKRQGIKSPDRADSFMMQFATQAPQLSTGNSTGHAKPVIAQSETNFNESW